MLATTRGAPETLCGMHLHLEQLGIIQLLTFGNELVNIVILFLF